MLMFDCSGFVANLLHYSVSGTRTAMGELIQLKSADDKPWSDAAEIGAWNTAYFLAYANPAFPLPGPNGHTVDPTMAFWTTNPIRRAGQGGTRLESARQGDYFVYMRKDKATGKLKPIHMSLFYAGPNGEKQADCSSGTCRYQILHASGMSQRSGHIFNRKVVINDMPDPLVAGDPIGFGRIKLWD